MPKKRMHKIKYVGNTRRGTITPRKMWWPGETMKVSPEVAEELLEDPDFVLVKSEKKK